MSILVDKNTCLLVQGITGREGTFHTNQMIAFGTNVVGGVVPGKGGQTFEGDRVRIDVRNHIIDLLVDEETLADRKTRWVIPEPRYTKGVLAKYAKLALGADVGAVTSA